MDQLRNFADERLISGCTYCGGAEETRDHVPARVLLDSPLPENLPVVSACRSCNNGSSLDEEYLACLIEAVIVGSTDPDRIRRPSIASTLRRSHALRSKLEAAKSTVGGNVRFEIEPDRIRNVVVKFARGHAAYELSQPCRGAPVVVNWWPLCLMTDVERSAYEAGQVVRVFGEVGSRMSQRMIVAQFTQGRMSGEHSTFGAPINTWMHVQEGRYRYLAIDEADEIRIKLVVGEYLACEVGWVKD